MAKKTSKILVIDDEEPICLLLKWILKKEFEVVTFSSGVEALLWLKEGNSPDLIISDIKMPNFNGIDFVKGMKKSGMYRNIPIVLLSGSVEGKNQEEGLDAGACRFISKPFDPDFLKETIKEVLTIASNKPLIKH